MTDQLMVFSPSGFSGPQAQVFTYAVAPAGVASLASGKVPIWRGIPFTANRGRTGSASASSRLR